MRHRARHLTRCGTLHAIVGAAGGVQGTETASLRETVATATTLGAVGAQASDGFGTVDGWVRCIAAAGRGVVMTMGKGGVAETTLSGTPAVTVARSGHRVQRSTTD